MFTVLVLSQRPADWGGVRPGALRFEVDDDNVNIFIVTIRPNVARALMTNNIEAFVGKSEF